MGFNILFYITFGTNLLTGGPVPISNFLPILEFSRKGIPNGVQTEWNLHYDLSWTESKPGDLEMKSEKQQGGHEGGGRAQGVGRAPYLVGPLEGSWPNSFAHIYSYTLDRSQRDTKPLFHHRNLLYPWDHRGAFSGVLPGDDSIMEGFYINTITLPMKRE